MSAASAQAVYSGRPVGSPAGRRAALVIAALLTVHALLAIHTATRLSVTHDEYWHLPAGLLAWKTGRFDCDDLNPPLTRLWAALPLVGMPAKDLAQCRDAFELGNRFLEIAGDRYETLYAIGRSMNVVWSILTGIVIALWSRRLFGDRAAYLAVALWVFCPTVVANAALVTPDMGATCLFAATLFSAWCFAEKPTWKLAALLGTLVGLAQLAKFTNLLLYVLVPVVYLVVRWSGLNRTRHSGNDPRAGPSAMSATPATTSATANPSAPTSRGWMWKLMLAGAISFLVLDAGYFFRGTGSRLADLSFESAAIQPLNRIGAPWRNVPIPIPADYLRGVDHQRRIMEAEHPVYLDGTWRTSGFPDYFVRALGYKLSHATQYLLFLAVVWLIFPGREPRLMASQFALLIPAALLLLLGSTTSMQLGIRYQLPAFPLMFIFAGQTARWIDWKQYRLRAVLVCVAIAALPFSWRYHPHHIAYFNELAGGPTGGANHLLDSNIDWGQDLGGLQHYVDEQGLGEIGLAYFGMVPPSHAGFSYRLPPSRLPAPGWYAVSLNFVYGRPHTIRNPAGVDPPIRSVDFEEFGYFRLFQPSARIGWSIYVYHLTPADIERVGLPSG